MTHPRFASLWTKYLDGPLAAAEDQALAEMLSAGATQPEEALRDAEFHGLLQALGRVDATQSDFVTGVVRRLWEAREEPFEFPQAPRAPSPGPTPDANAEAHSRDVAPPPIAPPIPVFAGQQPPQSPRLPIAAPAILAQPRPPRSRRVTADPAPRTRAAWRTIGYAAALVGLIGLGVVLAVARTSLRPVATGTDAYQPETPPQHDMTAATTPIQGGDQAGDPAAVEAVSKSIELASPRPPSPDSVARRAPGENTDDSGSAKRNPSERVQQPAAARQVFGRIVDDTRAVWDSHVASDLTGGLRLREGTVTIALTDGAILVAYGPADFELSSSNSVSLERGKVTAQAPAAAVGFSIVTPSSRVVDLGTEFVVDVDDAGATAVHVVRGTVEMSTAQQRDDDPPWRLTSGQYKWVSLDGAQSLDWRMHLVVDATTFEGLLNLNGQEFPVKNAGEFVPMYINVTQELSQLLRLVSAPRNARVATPFRAEINLNGQRWLISDTMEYNRAYRRVMAQLRQLMSDALRKGAGASSGVFGGSFNINGQEFRINGLDDLQHLQEEIKRRAANGFNPAPDSDGQ